MTGHNKESAPMIRLILAVSLFAVPALAQAPQGQSLQGQAPQGQAPQGQAPQGQAPQGQSPQGQSPQGKAPQAQMAMPMPGSAPGAAPSTTAYRRAMDTMMHGMDVPYTGNADHDFVTGMLPHHQGAVDMARVELQYGHDPALKKLARDIIASQSREQTFMRNWLARHPLPDAAPKP
jgi:hypothetical protein